MLSLNPRLPCEVYVAPEFRAELPKASGKVQVHRFEEVIAMGHAVPGATTPPKPDTMAVIMYTSGSTGTPKGVL